ncbi:MAG: Nucleoside triphosphate pyrophosphohydrolase [Syntrophomonadaceae bacterium]|nr:Nucleoside triphosphate pyrophosphohydrolase [Bacillota bacterium]
MAVPIYPDALRAEKLAAFDRLLTIMDQLRNHCPWDKKQTMETLRYLSIEETFELSDAIIEGDLNEVRKELGDLFLHLVFYSKIGEEQNAFNVAEVLNGICEKLIHRHPHIYSDVQVADEEEVKRNWEAIKLQEKGDNQIPKGVMDGVPKSLPALIKAMRIQEKARGIGFDWENATQVWEKVEEELSELKEALTLSKEKAEEEMGDLLFSLINYSRFVNINPDDALEATNKKFLYRFAYMERAIAESGRCFKDLSLAEMEVYWQEAKGGEGRG